MVDHRWNCWFNTGKTMFSHQRTKNIHDFIVDFPWFSYVFPMNSAIWPGIFEAKHRDSSEVLQVDRLHGLPQKLLPVLVTEISGSLRLVGDQTPTEIAENDQNAVTRNLKIKVRRERYRRAASSKLRLDLRNVAWNVVCLRCTGMGSASIPKRWWARWFWGGATTEKINLHMFINNSGECQRTTLW